MSSTSQPFLLFTTALVPNLLNKWHVCDPPWIGASQLGSQDCVALAQSK